MKIYSIYRITDLLNGKVYIGYTNNVNVRWTNHRYAAKVKTTTALYHAINKHGIENFTFDVIYQSLDRGHTLNEMEPHFIKDYNSYAPFGYNLTFGGEGVEGLKHSEEANLAKSIRQKGVKKSEEHTAKKIANQSGKVRPVEVGIKISQSKKGKPRSIEASLKTKIANTGKKRTAEQNAATSTRLTGVPNTKNRDRNRANAALYDVFEIDTDTLIASNICAADFADSVGIAYDLLRPKVVRDMKYKNYRFVKTRERIAT